MWLSAIRLALEEVAASVVADDKAGEAGPQDSSASNVVRQGFLGVRKRKGLERRYFVLSDDCLEYFDSQEATGSNPNPRGRVTLKEVQSLDFEDRSLEEEDSIVIHLPNDRSLVLCSLDGANLANWFDALQARLSSDKQQNDTEVDQVLNESEAQLPEKVVKFVEPTPPENSQEAPWVMRSEKVEEIGRIVCQGPLRLERKGKVSLRYFVLLETGLLYYMDANDASSGNDLRGRIALHDIESFGKVGLSFSLYLRGTEQPMKLHVGKNEEFDLWLSALTELLALRDQNDTQQATTPTRTSRSHSWGSAVSDMARGSRACHRWAALQRSSHCRGRHWEGGVRRPLQGPLGVFP